MADGADNEYSVLSHPTLVAETANYPSHYYVELLYLASSAGSPCTAERGLI